MQNAGHTSISADNSIRGARVSIIIPCYNQSRFLGEAIQSALNQSYQNSEIVVVDDGSIDDTAMVAARYPGIDLVRQDNLGLSAARNAGAQAGSGALLIFLDADDRLLPNAVEAGIECLERAPQCAFVYGRYRLVTEDGLPISAQIRVAPNGDYFDMLRFNHIGMPATVLYRRTVFDVVGGFDTSLAACEDYDLYLRIARHHPIGRHVNVVAEYRQHAGNMSSNAELMLKSALQVLGREFQYVRGSKPAMEAYRQGKRYWQDYYGTKLIRALRHRIRAGAWTDVLRGGLVLLRYYPAGIIRKILKKARSIATLAPRFFTLKASR